MAIDKELTRRAVLQGSAVIGTAALTSCPAWAEPPAGRQASLSIAMPANPETLDPHQFRSIFTGSVLACCVETLLTHNPDTMEIVPLLATSYRNIDPHTWELKLRTGVRFHNGEEFNADAVKFSIERIIDSPLNTLGKTVWPPSFGQQVEVVDPYTIRISTKIPDPILPNRLAAESMNMAPPKALAGFKDKFIGDQLTGTGPYKFVEYVVGRQLVFEANSDYWGEQPATPRLVWSVIPDPATRVAALQRGIADIGLN